MKQKKKFSSKTSRSSDSKSYGSNLYLIEGESASSEYLMHRPQVLKQIYCRSQKEIRWVRSFGAAGATPQSVEQWAKSSEERERHWASFFSR